MKIIYPLRLGLLCALVCTLFACGGSDSDDENQDLSNNACGEIGLSPRIIDGTACSAGPSGVVQFYVFNRQGEVGSCSGSMLDDVHILSAAHCADGTASAFLAWNGQRVNIRDVVIHPLYDAGSEGQSGFPEYDVAIFRLSRPVQAGRLPILLSRDVGNSDVISIFGYGIDNDGHLGQLRSGQMKIGREVNTVFLAEFSKHSGGSNTCSGDSGGPALYSYLDENGQTRRGIVGVTSYGLRPDCQKGDISGFANVQIDGIRDFVLGMVPGTGVQ